jgi:hypothetical protein
MVGQGGDVNPPFWHDNDVERGSDHGLIEPEKLADEPLDPVAPNGAPDLPADGKAQAPEKNALSRGQGEKNEVPALVPPAPGVALLELRPLRQAMALRKT